MQFHWKKMWKSSVITCHSLLQHTTWSSYGGSWSFSIGIFFYHRLFPSLSVFEILTRSMPSRKSGIGLLSNGAHWRGMVRVPRARCHSGSLLNSIRPRKFFTLSNKYFVTVAILFCMKILRPAFRKLTRSVLNFFFCLTPWIPIMRRRKGLVTRILFASCFINSFVYSFLGELKGVKIGRVSVVLF